MSVKADALATLLDGPELAETLFLEGMEVLECL